MPELSPDQPYTAPNNQAAQVPKPAAAVSTNQIASTYLPDGRNEESLREAMRLQAAAGNTNAPSPARTAPRSAYSAPNQPAVPTTQTAPAMADPKNAVEAAQYFHELAKNTPDAYQNPRVGAKLLAESFGRVSLGFNETIRSINDIANSGLSTEAHPLGPQAHAMALVAYEQGWRMRDGGMTNLGKLKQYLDDAVMLPEYNKDRARHHADLTAIGYRYTPEQLVQLESDAKTIYAASGAHNEAPPQKEKKKGWGFHWEFGIGKKSGNSP